MTSLAYLTGRAFGAALSPLAPVLDALLEGLLDSVFGEPDEVDNFEPIAAPEPYDGPWVLDEERLREVAFPSHHERVPEIDDLRRIGDHLQSEASRLASWIRTTAEEVGIENETPYEAEQALLAVEGAVNEWTGARVAHATRGAA